MNREETMQALEYTYDAAQAIDRWLSKGEKWIYYKSENTVKMVLAAPFWIVGFFVFLWVLTPIINFVFEDGSIIQALAGCVSLIIVFVFGFYAVNKICDYKIDKYFANAHDVRKFYGSLLDFLPDISYCRVDPYQHMYSMLKAGRCNNLNEALASWDEEFKHMSLVNSQNKIANELKTLNNKIGY